MAQTTDNPEKPARPGKPKKATVTGYRDNSTESARVGVSLIWVVGFLVVFFTQSLPNNPISRWVVWQEVPFQLMDWIDPQKSGPTQSGWNYLPERFAMLGYAALIISSGWAWGHLILRLIRRSQSERSIETTIFAFGLGYSFLTLLALGLGLAGFMHRATWLVLLAFAVVAECLLQAVPGTRRTNRRCANSQDSQASSLQPALIWFCRIAMACFLISMLFGAMSPSTDFDVREYHLQGPKEWLQAGQITFLEHNVYASFPFLSEMLTLIGMIVHGDWWAGALVGKVVLMSFAPLSAMAVYAAGRRWFSRDAGILAATIHLSTPWTYRISIVAYAEGAISFFMVAGMLAIGMAIEQLQPSQGDSDSTQDAEQGSGDSSSDSSSISLPLIAGLLAGSAMASKYPGVISAVIPFGLVLLFNLLRKRNQFAWKSLVVFCAAVFITIGPWLAKNYAHTGNPVYPLVYSVFGGVDWNEPLDARWKKAHGPDHHRISDLGRKAFDVTVLSDWQSPLLFAFAPLAFWVTGRRRATIGLWLFTVWLFATWWVLTHRLDRFWVPMIPIVCVLAGAGMSSLKHSLWQIVTAVVLMLAVIFNFVFSTSGLGGYNAWLTKMSVAKQTAMKPGIRLLNESLPPGSRVLCVGEAEVFDAEFDLLYHTVFDECLLERWATNEQKELEIEGLKVRLQQERITHIYVNWQEILRYRLPGSYQYTDFIDKKLFEKLLAENVVQTPTRPLMQFPPLLAKQLDKSSRTEIKNWSPELITDEDSAMIRAELYRVAD